MKTKPEKNKTLHLISGILIMLFMIMNSIYADIFSDIDALYKKNNFSHALEKALTTLSTNNKFDDGQKAYLTYIIAACYQQNKNKQMAEQYYQEIIQKYPKSPYLKETYIALADLYQQDYFKREGFLEKLLETFPNTKEAIRYGLELSKNALQLKNYQKAIALLEKLVVDWKADSTHPELNIMLATAYSAAKDHIEAIGYLRKTAKNNPELLINNPNYLYEAGKIYYNNLHFQEAIEVLRKLINIYPDFNEYADASLLLAKAFERENNPYSAALFLIKALEKKPTRNLQYAIMLDLGRMLLEFPQKDLEKFAENYPNYADPEKLLKFVQSNSPNFDQKREAAILQSNLLKKNQNHEQIIENYFNFLKDRRDNYTISLFQKSISTYIDLLNKEKNKEKIFSLWSMVRSRKSYLSGENLLEFGQALFDLNVLYSAEEVYEHISKYSTFKKFWPISKLQLTRIKFKLEKYADCLDVIESLTDLTEKEQDEFSYYKISSLKQTAKKELFENEIKKIAVRQPETDYQFLVLLEKIIYLDDQQHYEQALTIALQLMRYPQITEIQSDNLLLRMADLYFKLKEYDNALVLYNQLEKQKINLEWIYSQKIKIFRQTDRQNEAAKILAALKSLNAESFWLNQLEKQ